MIPLALTLLASAPSAQPNYEAAWEYASKFRSQAVLVMVDGKVAFERYANGGGKDEIQAMASGSKSFCGVVAAAAATDGLIRYDERVADTFSEWKRDARKSRITVRQLLSLSSGMPVGSRGREGGERDGWETAKGLKPVFEPGAQFAYGPNSFNIFGALMEAKLKGEKWEAYLDRRINKPLGIKVLYRGKCADGNPQLAGGGWITARDWLTFGEFVRQEGRWNGKQLIDAGLMKELYQPTKSNPAYGMSWWLGQDGELEMMSGRSRAAAEGFRMAAGAGKQRCYIVPSAKMVIVRMGKVSLGGQGWSDQEFLETLVPH
ncbi:MAG: beta-lactamase family protein [Chthonomonas sp.]|nr:beta-lactamase family protein [Chthonomonas sp.]